MKNKNYSPEGNIGKKSLGGLKWGGVDKATNIIIQLVVGVILARLLPPEDFGLIGLAMIIVGFGQVIVDLGLGPALIQRKTITEKHIRVCFTTSGLLGCLIATLVFILANPIAVLLDSSRVIPIIEALSLIFVFKSLEISSFSILRKKLDFKSIFYVNTASNIAYGIVTITLALIGWGVWSLVLGIIIKSFVELITNFIYAPHSVTPLLSKKELKDLAHFGTGMTINRIFNYFALKGDYFFVGRILGAYSLGIYTKAYNLMQMPTSQFVSVLSDVLFPAASVIQDDIDRSKRVFLKSIGIVGFVTTPICFMIVVLAPNIIVGIYGVKWAEAVVPLQILGCVGFLRATYNVGGAFLRAKGLVYKLFYSNLIYGIAMCIGVWYGAKFYGLEAAAIAVSFAIVLIWLSVMFFNTQSLKINFSEICLAHIPGILVGVISMGGVFLFRQFIMNYIHSPLVVLIICLPVTLILVVLVVYILPKRLFFGVSDKLIATINQIKMSSKVKLLVLKILK